MKKIIFPIVVIALFAIFIILTPRQINNISAYQDNGGELLQPQKNVVIISINLNDNQLNLKKLDSITKLRELNSEFIKMPGVNKVDSILNISIIKSVDQDVQVNRFIPENISNNELETIIDNFYLYPELKPFISENGKAILFYVYFGFSMKPTEILKNIQEIESFSSIKYNYTGKSPIIAITENLLSKDIIIFLPLLFIFIMGIFLSFRSLKAIIISWSVIIFSVLLSYSLVIFSGIEVTPLILLVPVFSLGLLSDYLIHYFYHLFYEPQKNNSLIIRKNLLYPLGLTALSTLTGFISLIFINASGHVLLGSIIALSVIITFIGVILWLPYLNFTHPSKNLLPRFSHYQILFFDKLYKNKKWLFIIMLAGVIWGILTLPKLRVEPYPIEQLPINSTIRNAERSINNDFYGSIPFFIEIDGGKVNTFLEKETLLQLDQIHNQLESINEIKMSYSLLTVLKRINFYFNGNEESLLSSNEYDDYYSSLIDQYLLYYSSGVEPTEYESLLDQSYRYFSIKGYIQYKNVESLNNFTNVVKDIKKRLPDGWDINTYGILDELDKEKNGLTRNWIFSFVLGSLLIFFSVLIFYKKLKLALVSLIPGFISMILSFGIISSLGVTIDSFSIIFVAIITGLVIDYSIHTLSALDRLTNIDSIKSGFSFIVSYSGIPIFLSFLTSLSSFSVLFLSSFKGARSLGILLFTSLLFSYFLSFYLLPIIILPTKLKKEQK